MGILFHISDGLSDVFQKFDYQTSIDYHTSRLPEYAGRLFEDHVQSLFSPGNFRLVERNHSSGKDPERNVESSKNFDFIFEHLPTRETFAVGCNYPAKLNEKGQLEWSYPEQLKGYREFESKRKIPVYIVIGYDKVTKEWDRYTRQYYKKIEKIMYNIPLKEIKSPVMYSKIYSNFERNYYGKFFWNKGTLY